MGNLHSRVALKLGRRQYLSRANAASQVAVSVEPNALAYQGLNVDSLALIGMRTSSSTRVNLLLPELTNHGLFAGIRTALEVGFRVAAQLDAPLRIVVFNSAASGRQTQEIVDNLRNEFSDAVRAISVASVYDIRSEGYSDGDTWIATYWTTAHAADVAARLGLIDPRRVLYLIQDYEPAFLSASTEQALAAATYHAGFVQIVNSSPLQSFLTAQESVTIGDDRTFAPRLDQLRLEEAAASRVKSSTLRVMFYGRPSKPRNMFKLGAATLRAANTTLAASGRKVEFQSIGESHPDIDLSRGVRLKALGKVSWSEYFRRLSTADVLLSLQASPHPSHPPLDAVLSGGRAVTNDLAGTRTGIHERLFAASPDPDLLASSVAEAAAQHDAAKSAEGFDSGFLSSLGVDLEDAIDAGIKMLGCQ